MSQWKLSSIAIGIVLATTLLLLVFKPGGSDFVGDLDNIEMLISAWLATFMVFRLTRHAQGSPHAASPHPRSDKNGDCICLRGRNRRGWTFIGAGCLSWAAGQTAFCYYELVRDVPAPYPSLADLGFDTAPFWFCGAIVVWFSARKGARIRIVCDGLIVASATIVTMYGLLLGHDFPLHDPHLSTRIISIAYPLGEVIMITLVVLLAVNVTRSQRGVVLLLAAGLSSLAIADIAYDYLQQSDSYQTGFFLDIGWTACFLLIVAATRHKMATSVNWEEEQTLSISKSLLPNVPLVLAVITFAIQDRTHEFGVFEWSMVAVLVILTRLRHFITLLENKAMATSLARSNKQLVENEERYRSVVDTINEVTFHVDSTGHILFLNHSWQRLTGHDSSACEGTSIFDYVSPVDHERAAARVFGGHIIDGIVRPIQIITDSGEIKLVEIQAVGIGDDARGGFIGSMKDVTTRHVLEGELRVSHKLESVGRLAKGVAHKIGSPTQFIADNLRFLGDSTDKLLTLGEQYRNAPVESDSKAMAEWLSEVARAADAADLKFLAQEMPLAITESLKGTERITHFVRAMIASIDSDDQMLRSIDINITLQDAIEIAQSELETVADIQTNFGDIPSIKCFGSAINGVFLNLLTNAGHAVQDSGVRGLITITTSHEEDAVTVAIADSGIGIEEKSQSRVFEQFFTTRETGQGAGLGLALARATIKNMGGTIHFESKLGSGTTFFVRLPIAPRKVDSFSRFGASPLLTSAETSANY